MEERKRIVYIVLVMSALVLTVGVFSNILLYTISFNETTNHLEDSVQVLSHMIEAQATSADALLLADWPASRHSQVVERIRNAINQYERHNRKMELTVALRKGNIIHFLVALRHRGHALYPVELGMDSGLAEPMRKALEGGSGTMVGRDYHGMKVLAAYEYIPGMKLGIVAKINLADLRAPFIRAGLIIICISVLIIVAGIAVIGRISSPLVRSIEEKANKLAAANEDLACANEELQAAMEEMEQTNEQLHSTMEEIERTNEELARSRQDLLQSEGRIRALLEGSPIGILTADRETRRFLYANPSACAMFGYDCDEMLSLSVSEIHPVEAMDAIYADFEALANNIRQISHEIPCLKKDGTIFYADITAAPVIFEGRLCLLGQFVDITERRQAMEALRESEEQFAKAFHWSPISVAISSADGKYIDVNEEFLALTGYTRDEIVGRSSSDLHLWVDEHGIEEAHEEVRGGRLVHDYQAEIRSKSGKISTVLYSAVNITLRGKPCVIKSVIDITEHRRAMEALRESEEKFAKAFMHAPILMSISDIEDGTIIEVNSRFIEQSGYTRKEVIGKSTIDLGWVRAADRKRFQEKVIQEGAAKSLDLTVYPKQGPPLDVIYSGERITIGGKSLLLSIAIDVTEQKRAEMALRESEERYRRIIESITDYIYTVQIEDGKPGGTVHGSACFAVTGYTADELNDDPYLWISMVHPEDRDAVKSRAERLMYDKQEAPLEHRIIRKDGTMRWVRNSSVPYRDSDGNLVAYDGIIVDITERKLAEETLQRSEEKYRRLFNEISSGFALHEMIFDGAGRPLDYRFLEVNPAFEELTGLRDVVGRTVREVLPGIEEYWIQSYGRVVMTAKAEVFENYAEPLGHWYEVRVYPRRGNLFVVIFNDISDRKRAEKNLLEKTEELDRYFSVNLDLLCIADTEGRFVRINPEWEIALGYRVQEIEGKRFFDFIHPDDLPRTMAAVGDLSNKKDVLNFVNRYRRSDGSYRWLEWRSTSPDGFHIYAAARDVTEQYLITNELKKQRETAQMYLDIAGVMIIAIGADQRVTLINRKGCEILGYPADLVLGRNWFEMFLSESNREMAKGIFEQLIHGDMDSAQYAENMVVTASGSERLIAWHNTLLKDESGTITGTLSSGEDITERKKAEEDLHNQLAYNMALAGLSGSIISRSFSIADIANIVLEYARILTDSTLGFVTEIDADTGAITCHTFPMMQDACSIYERMEEGHCKKGEDGIYPRLWGHALNTHREFYTNDPVSHPASKGFTEGHMEIKRFLSVPVMFGGTLVGQIALANPPRDYTMADLTMTRRLASIYAMAIVRIRDEHMLLKSLEEKTVLIKELHHRVKNNMQVISSMISLQARKIDDEKYRDIFLESSNRIQAMAMVHEKIYHSGDVARVDFSRYVREIAERLLSSFSTVQGQVDLEVDVRDIYLGIDEAIPCGIIINELITNAFKHAFSGGRPGKLSIQFAIGPEGKRHLVVKDNGRGIPKDILSSPGDSLGMQIVNALTNQLNGTIEMSGDGGTRVEIVF